MTEKEVKKLLKENKRTWEEFMDFMIGQTMGLEEDGSSNYYECDVDRFIKRLKVID